MIDIDALQKLLKTLYPEEVSPDILTVSDVEYRYRFSGRGEPAMQAIAQARRISLAKGNYQQAGLCAFHIGLIYWNWQDYGEAVQQFAAARQQWRFVTETAAVCLTHFAEGAAREAALFYEEGMTQYGRAKQLLPRLRLVKTNRIHDFLKAIEPLISAGQEALRDKLWPPEASDSETTDSEASGSETPTTEDDDSHTNPARPVHHLANIRQDTSPVPHHQNIDVQYQWYRPEKHIRNIFGKNISEDGWLLVNTKASGEEYKSTHLIVVRYDKLLQGAIKVTPFNPDSEEAYVGIYFVTEQWTGEFTRDTPTGEVVFGKGQKRIPVADVNIIGIVIGFWEQLLASKKKIEGAES